MESLEIKKFIASFLLTSVLISGGATFIFRDTDGSLGGDKEETAEGTYVPQNAFVEPLPETTNHVEDSSDNLPSVRPGNLTDNLVRSFAANTLEKNPTGPELTAEGLAALAPDVDRVVDGAIKGPDLAHLVRIDKEEEGLKGKIRIKENETKEDVVSYVNKLNAIISRRLGSIDPASIVGNPPSLNGISAMQLLIATAKREVSELEAPGSLKEMHLAMLTSLTHTHASFGLLTESPDPLKDMMTLQLRLARLDVSLATFRSYYSGLNLSSLAPSEFKLSSLFVVGTAMAQIPVTDAALNSQSLRDYLIQVAVAIIKDRLIKNIINQTINWIQGGGKPQFISNWKGFLKDVGNAAVGDAAFAIAPGLCRSFGPLIWLGFNAPRGVTPAPVGCTLDSIIGNIQEFADNFENGGWIAYGAAIQPRNNLFGTLLSVNMRITSEKARAGEETFTKTLSAHGFKDQTQCATALQPLKFNACMSANAGNPLRTALCEPLRSQLECPAFKLTTPGVVVEGTLHTALSADVHKIVNAQDITALISAFINAALTRLSKLGSGSDSPGILASSMGGPIDNSPPPSPTNPCAGKTGSELNSCLENFRGACAGSSGDVRTNCINTICGGLSPSDFQLCRSVVLGGGDEECPNPQCTCKPPNSQFRYLGNVGQAIAAVQANPAANGLDPNDTSRITDFDRYHLGVVCNLRAGGFVAHHDGEEIGIYRSGDTFQEQMDISTFNGFVFGPNNNSICRAPGFPDFTNSDPPVAGSSLTCP